MVGLELIAHQDMALAVVAVQVERGQMELLPLVETVVMEAHHLLVAHQLPMLAGVVAALNPTVLPEQGVLAVVAVVQHQEMLRQVWPTQAVEVAAEVLWMVVGLGTQAAQAVPAS